MALIYSSSPAPIAPLSLQTGTVLDKFDPTTYYDWRFDGYSDHHAHERPITRRRLPPPLENLMVYDFRGTLHLTEVHSLREIALPFEVKAVPDEDLVALFFKEVNSKLEKPLATEGVQESHRYLSGFFSAPGAVGSEEGLKDDLRVILRVMAREAGFVLKNGRASIGIRTGFGDIEPEIVNDFRCSESFDPFRYGPLSIALIDRLKSLAAGLFARNRPMSVVRLDPNLRIEMKEAGKFKYPVSEGHADRLIAYRKDSYISGPALERIYVGARGSSHTQRLQDDATYREILQLQEEITGNPPHLPALNALPAPTGKPKILPARDLETGGISPSAGTAPVWLRYDQDRLSLYKTPTGRESPLRYKRLSYPFHDIVLYDDNSCLQMALAPTDEGQVIDPLREVVLPSRVLLAPGEDLAQAFLTRVNQNLRRPLLADYDGAEIRGRTGRPTFNPGSFEGFVQDLGVVLQRLARENDIVLRKGNMLFYYQTGTETEAPCFEFDANNRPVTTDSFRQFSYDPLYEVMVNLIEDLAPGLIARNYPIGIALDPANTHQARNDIFRERRHADYKVARIRSLVVIEAGQMQSGHQLVEDGLRLEEIREAAIKARAEAKRDPQSKENGASEGGVDGS